MFTDDIARRAEVVITNIYEDIEQELMDRFVEDVMAGKGSGDIADWRARKLREIRVYSRTWQRTLETSIRRHQSEIDKAVEAGLRDAVTADDEMFRRMFDEVTDGATSEAFSRRLDIVVAACHDYVNLTGTQAIAQLQDAFIRAVNDVYIRVLTGVETVDGAIRRACNEVASRGAVVTYRTQSGRIINYPLDATVRRDIMTTLVQAAAQITVERNEEYGNDLVQVSAHFGARPSHAVWQGRVYSLTGRTKGYRLLSEATGYGTAEGLCGINCRHTFWPYFAGFSKEEQEKVGLTENRERYENQQRQRWFEREMRRYKREIRAARQTGDDSRLPRLRKGYEARRAQYEDFLQATRLTRFRERETA